MKRGKEKQSKTKGAKSPKAARNIDDEGGGMLTLYDPRWFMVDDASVGGRLKKANDVVRTRIEDHSKQKLNVNCRVETLGRVIDLFCEKKRRWVAEMGFDSLVHLADKGLPRHLCYWLASRVDVAKRCLTTLDGVVFPLTKVQVHWVLGIPIGPKIVPSEAKDEITKSKVDRIWDTYNTKSPAGTVGITRSTILTHVEGDGVDEEAFKCAFLMMVLGDFLCPTTCHRLSVALLPAVTTAMEASKYDWCSFVIDHLFTALRNFAERFYVDGYAAGCGGCTFFLAIVYLDRLKRPPLQWGVFPRIKSWRQADLVEAKVEDQLEGLDFGKLGCYDIAYGERHPLQGRDLMPPSSLPGRDLMPSRSSDDPSGGNALVVIEDEPGKPPEGRKRRRRGATTDLNPYDYVIRRKNNASGQQPKLDQPVVEHSSVSEHADEAGSTSNCNFSDLTIEAIHVPKPALDNAYKPDIRDHSVCNDETAASEPNNGGDCAGNGAIHMKNLDGDTQCVPSDQDPKDIYGAVTEVQLLGESDAQLDEMLRWCEKFPDRVPEQQSAPECENSVDIADFVQDMNFPFDPPSPSTPTSLRAHDCNVDQIVSTLSGYASTNLDSTSLTLSKYVVGLNMPPLFSPKKHKNEPLASPPKSYSSYDDVESQRDVQQPCEASEEATSPMILKDPVQVVEKNGKVQRSRTPRKTKSCFKLSDSYVQMWRPHNIRRYKKRLSMFVDIASGELVSKDTVLLSCNGYSASLGDCSSVSISSIPVSTEYVRVAAQLYKKVWDMKHMDRSKRFMLDPAFANEVLYTEDVSNLAHASLQGSPSLNSIKSFEDINMIFVPILQSNHWWCAAFSIISSEVAVIDAMEVTKAAEAHHLDLLKLMHGIDELLHCIDPAWELGRAMSFKAYSVEIPIQVELMDSGAVMLVAIKRRAARLGYNIYMEDMKAEIPWLLCEDIMNGFNQSKGAVLDLINEHMK